MPLASAIVAAAVLAAGGAAMFAATPASRCWRPPGAAANRRHRPVLTQGTATLLATGLGAGMAAGLVNIGIPAVAIALHGPALAGTMFALASAGDLVGGRLYGSRSWRLPVLWRLHLAQFGSALVIAVMGLASTPPELAVLMLVGGVFGGPAAIAQVRPT